MEMVTADRTPGGGDGEYEATMTSYETTTYNGVKKILEVDFERKVEEIVRRTSAINLNTRYEVKSDLIEHEKKIGSCFKEMCNTIYGYSYSSAVLSLNKVAKLENTILKHLYPRESDKYNIEHKIEECLQNIIIRAQEHHSIYQPIAITTNVDVLKLRLKEQKEKFAHYAPDQRYFMSHVVNSPQGAALINLLVTQCLIESMKKE